MKNFYRICSIILISIFYLSLSISNVYSADASVNNNVNRPDAIVNSGASTKATAQPLVKLQNPLNAANIQDVVYLAIDLAIYVGVAFAIIGLVWVGFKFILAQGNPKEISAARDWFFYIIIGLAILISSKVIVEIVKTTLINSNVIDKSVFERRVNK